MTENLLYWIITTLFALIASIAASLSVSMLKDIKKENENRKIEIKDLGIKLEEFKLVLTKQKMQILYLNKYYKSLKVNYNRLLSKYNELKQKENQ